MHRKGELCPGNENGEGTGGITLHGSAGSMIIPAMFQWGDGMGFEAGFMDTGRQASATWPDGDAFHHRERVVRFWRKGQEGMCKVAVGGGGAALHDENGGTRQVWLRERVGLVMLGKH